MPEEPATMLRVMLVDDHEIVRSGITAMLAATDGIRVVAEAESVQDAIREAERTRPDVVVMDIRLVDGSGIEATRAIRDRWPDIKVLMLTSFADDEALYASIMAGAAAYVLKQNKGGDLVQFARDAFSLVDHCQPTQLITHPAEFERDDGLTCEAFNQCDVHGSKWSRARRTCYRHRPENFAVRQQWHAHRGAECETEQHRTKGRGRRVWLGDNQGPARADHRGRERPFDGNARSPGQAVSTGAISGANRQVAGLRAERGDGG